MKSRKRSSAVLEYSVLIAAVIAALIGMSFLVKGAICGRWRGNADVFGHGRQYDSKTTTIQINK